jgi:hypothetical protein
MISPIVTELPRRLEPISRDTFVDGAWRPAPKRPRPAAALATVTPLRPGLAGASPAQRAAA